MRNKILFFLLILTTHCSWAQTDKLQSLSPLNWAIVPPAEFIKPPGFPAFVHIQKRASIILMELKSPFTALQIDVNEVNESMKNDLLISSELVELNGKMATLTHAKQAINGITNLTYSLKFGDATKTVVATGIYPETFKELAPVIKQALLSIKPMAAPEGLPAATKNVQQQLEFSAEHRSKLVKIKGTKLSIIPPQDFAPATNFAGFQNIEHGASILATDIPAPYNSLIGDFTKENMAKRNMTLVDRQPVKIQDAEAMFFTITQAVNGLTFLKYMLIFAHPNGTAMLTSTLPETAKALEPEMKESILSAVYDDSSPEGSEADANFSLNIEGTALKFVRYFSGSLLYATDGKIPTNAPTFIAGSSLSTVPVTDFKQYAIERFKKLPTGAQATVNKVNEITVNQLNGYEIEATGSKGELLYQAMLFTPTNEYFIFVGQAATAPADNLTMFKKVTQTFKKK